MWYAFLCSVTSVLGGMFGYLIGWGFMGGVGYRILAFYGAHRRFDYLKALYDRYDAWAVAIAGFTPIPYKLFTIAGGVFRIDFKVFVLASAVSRSARFFLVAGLIYLYGDPIREFIDQYFDILSVLFFVLLILGFIVIRWALNQKRQPQLSR
jgi:membrane protein YqaA with SNARE-associated domain